MSVAGLEPIFGNTIVMCAFLWILSPYAHLADFLIHGKPFKNMMDIDEREILTAVGERFTMNFMLHWII
jgi:hypothetical protein